MTPRERRRPDIIDGSRKRRIAAGAGVQLPEVNRLLKQFDQMRVLMKQMATGTPPTPQQIAQMQGVKTPRPRRVRR